MGLGMAERERVRLRCDAPAMLPQPAAIAMVQGLHWVISVHSTAERLQACWPSLPRHADVPEKILVGLHETEKQASLCHDLEHVGQ